MRFSARVAALSVFALPSFAVKEADVLYVGPVVAETTSTAVTGYLDGPKLEPVTANETSYDWWYFDAVSATTDASVTIVFYDSGPSGFINTYHTGPYSVGLSGSFANGTLWSADIDATGGVTITTSLDGSITGTWTGSDTATFVGTEFTEYVITIDAPSIGVYGNITFSSLSAPHYPCGPNEGGSDEMMVPHVWWANAVPDATAVVALTIGDAELNFIDGVGYHDKNWGDVPFVSAVSSWYWGHAHVGPYSIVWFDAIDSSGVEHYSGYVTEGSSILESSCATSAVTVRPWGANDEYPPLATTGVMQGLEATFLLTDGSTLLANITTGLVVVNADGAYVRTLGTVDVSIGEASYTGGRALFEEFKFSAV